MSPDADPPPTLPQGRARWTWLIGGWAALALGTVGIFLPVLPLVGYMALFTDAPAWTLVVTLLLVVFGLSFIWSKPSWPEG